MPPSFVHIHLCYYIGKISMWNEITINIVMIKVKDTNPIIVINSPLEFQTYASKSTSVTSVFLSASDVQPESGECRRSFDD